MRLSAACGWDNGTISSAQLTRSNRLPIIFDSLIVVKAIRAAFKHMIHIEGAYYAERNRTRLVGSSGNAASGNRSLGVGNCQYRSIGLTGEGAISSPDR